MNNKERKEEPWKRGKKEMNNKEEKEEPWKRGKKGMNNKEAKEGPWKRGKKGMKNKEGKEEPWKRGKAKPEQRKQGWPIKWKRTNLGKISKSSPTSFVPGTGVDQDVPQGSTVQRESEDFSL